MPQTLPATKSGPHEWNYSANAGYCALYHNEKETKLADHPKLEDLAPGESMGFLVTPKGQLYLFLNGECHYEIATGLPTDVSLWGMADVYGNCVKIKSEIMSGEFSDVHVVTSPSQCGTINSITLLMIKYRSMQPCL